MTAAIAGDASLEVMWRTSTFLVRSVCVSLIVCYTAHTTVMVCFDKTPSVSMLITCIMLYPDIRDMRVAGLSSCRAAGAGIGRALKICGGRGVKKIYT